MTKTTLSVLHEGCFHHCDLFGSLWGLNSSDHGIKFADSFTVNNNQINQVQTTNYSGKSWANIYIQFERT